MNTYKPMQYRADIDGLRAIAVLLVLVFHFRLVDGGDVGFIGVDIFFVISGYLITAILVNDLKARRFTFTDFYLRRIRRLAPALFASLVLTFLAGAWLLFPADFKELSKQTLAAQLYVSNFYFWKNVSYFGISAQSAPLLHTWSLAVEEQFYLLYPILVYGLYRHCHKYFWAALSVLTLLSLFLCIFLSGVKPGFSFYLLPTRAWELLLGGLIVPLQQVVNRWFRLRSFVAFGSLALLAVALIIHGPTTVLPGWFVLLPTLAATGLILAGGMGSNQVSGLLSFGPLIFIGKISYPLYLVHWPVHVLAPSMLGSPYDWNTRFLCFCLSFLLAIFIWRWVEEPIRHRSLLGSRRGLLVAYICGLLLTVIVSMVVHVTNGLPQRFSPAVVKLAEAAFDRVEPLRECEYEDGMRFTEGFGCALGVAGEAPTWLIVGDSHAWAASDVLDRWLKQQGATAKFAYLHGCPPLHGVSTIGKGRCAAFNDEVRAYLSNASGIKSVMLISTWRQFIEGVVLDRQTGRVFNANVEVAPFNRVFKENLNWLKAHGFTTHLWEPVPGAVTDLPQALARSRRNGVDAELRMPLSNYLIDNDFFFTTAAEHAEVIDYRYSPSRRLCGANFCEVVVDGIPLYFDNAHISKSSWPVWLQVLQKPIERQN